MKIHIAYLIVLLLGLASHGFSKEPSDYTKFLSDMRQVQVAIQMFKMDATSSGSSPLYPRSADDLISQNYLSSKDFKKLTANSKAIFKSVPSDAPKSFVLFYLYRGDRIGKLTIGGPFEIKDTNAAEQDAAANP